MRFCFQLLSVLLIAGCVSLACEASEGAVGVACSVSRSRCTIAEPLEYSITVRVPEHASLASEIMPPSIKGFETSLLTAEEETVGKLLQIRRVYSLVPFSVGNFLIEGPVVGVNGYDVEASMLQLPSVQVDVQSVRYTDKKDELDATIKDIAGVLSLQYVNEMLILGFAVLLFFLFAQSPAAHKSFRYIFGVFDKYCLGRHKTMPVLPPHIVAYNALNALHDSDLLTKGMVKEYFTQLADILKTYIHKRYAIDTYDRTSIELSGQLAALGISDDVISLMREVMTQCDMVKFANVVPSDELIEIAFFTTKKIITKTIVVDNSAGEETGVNNE